MDDSKNPNIADTVFVDLRRQILGGKLSPGQRLTGERELAQRYNTNRNTLREAVRKLEQARLVKVRHGRGVTVSDFRKTGTLELLAPFLETGPDMSEVVQLVSDVLAPRILLLEHAARLAAQRADQVDIGRLRDISELMISAFASRDATVVARGFHRWLDALIDAGHSTAIRWIANPFLDALRDALERFPMLWVLEPSFPEHLRTLMKALETGDEELAVDTTQRYYRRVDKQLLRLLRAGLPAPRPVAAEAAAETPLAPDSEPNP